MSWSFDHASLDEPLAPQVDADLLLLQDLLPLCPLACSPPLIFNIEVSLLSMAHAVLTTTPLATLGVSTVLIAWYGGDGHEDARWFGHVLNLWVVTWGKNG